MMEFRTRVVIEPFERRIDHTKGGLSIGSCFADNMAAKLLRAKFPITANPLGVMFNPDYNMTHSRSTAFFYTTILGKGN